MNKIALGINICADYWTPKSNGFWQFQTKAKEFKYDTYHSVFIVDVHEMEDPTSCHTASKSVFTER